jgi:hypothetical protein
MRPLNLIKPINLFPSKESRAKAQIIRNNLVHFKNETRVSTTLKKNLHEPDLLHLKEYSKYYELDTYQTSTPPRKCQKYAHHPLRKDPNPSEDLNLIENIT